MGERLAASHAGDLLEQQVRNEAERKARAEVTRLAEAEVDARDAAARFAELERLAAERALDAASRQYRVQAERLSFDPSSVPQPDLAMLGAQAQRAAEPITTSPLPSSPQRVLDTSVETNRRANIERLAAERYKQLVGEAQKGAALNTTASTISARSDVMTPIGA